MTPPQVYDGRETKETSVTPNPLQGTAAVTRNHRHDYVLFCGVYLSVPSFTADTARAAIDADKALRMTNDWGESREMNQAQAASTARGSASRVAT